MAFVGNSPLNILTFGEIHGLGEGGGEVDVPLMALFTLDELDFSWETHSGHI
jgi:hypothetical protein